MSEEEAWTTPGVKQSFVLWPNRRRRDTRADFTGLKHGSGCQRLRCCRSASTVVSFSDSYNPQYASVFRRMHTLHVRFPSHHWPVFCSSLHVCRAKPAGVHHSLNWPLMQCKANVLKSFWYVFFLYCSFKYCALHRIFCHKLVNIYIFFFNIQTYTFIYTGQ